MTQYVGCYEISEFKSVECDTLIFLSFYAFVTVFIRNFGRLLTAFSCENIRKKKKGGVFMSGYGGYYDYGRQDPALAAYQQRMMEMQRAGYNPPPQYQPTPPPPGYRYEQVQQAPPQMPTMPAPKMRIVTSVEEARAAQVDLDGTPTFFRSPAEGKIYEKSIGLDGLPVFNTYQRIESPAPAQQQNPAITYADSKTVQDLQARVTQLENFLKGVANNVQSNANDAVNGTAPKQQ